VLYYLNNIHGIKKLRALMDDDAALFAGFVRAAAIEPDTVALDDGDCRLTFAEVERGARRLAARLSALVPGAPVGIALPSGVHYPVAMLAALAAGHPYVQLDVSFPEERNRFIVAHSRMEALFVSRATRALAHRIAPSLPLIDIDEPGGAGDDFVPAGTPDDVAFIVYTSGSEGQPKAVYHLQRTVSYWVAQIGAMDGYTRSSRHLLLYSPAVIPWNGTLFSALLNGAPVFIVDLARRGLDHVLEVIERAQITHVKAVPALFRRLVAVARPQSFASVRFLYLSGDRVFRADVDLARASFPPDCVLSIALGSSEAYRFCAWTIGRDTPLDTPLVPVGYPLEHYGVTLIDERGAPVAPGEIGEIVVRSRYLAPGYWNDEEATRRVFAAGPDDRGARLYHTGDLGRFRADGLLELAGRKDRQVKIRGVRVEPAELEAAIRLHPAVRDAAVITREVDGGAALAAYVAVAPASGVSEADIAAWCRGRLSEAMRPRDIRILDALPMLDSFKPDLAKLREMDGQCGARAAAQQPAPRGAAPARAPADPEAVRAAVRTAWLRVLDRASFENDSTWDDAGGDSLAALELLFELRMTLGRPVPRDLLDPDTRPSDIPARLQRSRAARPIDDGRAGLAALFVFPGVNRPDINYMRLARALAQHATIYMLDYPPVDPASVATTDVAGLFDRIVADAAEQIRASAAARRPLRLLGYSFGSFVALETAALLAAEGFDIAFLGALDTAPPMLDRLPWYLRDESVLHRLRRTIRQGLLLRHSPSHAWRVVCERNLERRRFGLIALMWHGVNLARLRRAAVILREAAGQYLRARSMLRRPLPHFPGRVFLFRATGNPRWNGEPPESDLAWLAHCERVSVAMIPGDHFTIFARENVEATKNAVVAALAVAEKTVETAG